MAENLRFYEAGRKVPQEAQKEFNNGRFRGTDINPMWRIKKLTELFGPAGLGWYYEVISERSETVGDTVMAIVDLHLYIKDPDSGEWSRPIFGTGGNVLLAKDRASDEGYKMALTDALSVACKALGIGADIYYSKDKTKYTAQQKSSEGNGRQVAGPTEVEGPAPGRQTRMGETGTISASPAPTEAPAGKPAQAEQGSRYRCRRCGAEIDEQTANVSYAESKMILCPECLQVYREWKAQQGGTN